MIDLKALQKRVYDNKVAKNFNTTDVHMEFCYMYSEVAEAFDAYIMKKGNIGEELADVAIFLLGLCEILDVDLETELTRKIAINEKRKYTQVNGVIIKLEDGENA